MKKKIAFSLLISFLLCFQGYLSAQQKQLSLNDIWASRMLSSENVYGINPLADGKTFAQIVNGALVVYSFETGDSLSALVKPAELTPENGDEPIALYDYSLSQDESKLLIPTETEAIYRHSTKSDYYIFDLKTRKLSQLSKSGKQQLATFSPNAEMVAFVRDNNIFIKHLQGGEEKQITYDGKLNEIINGAPDWVYEEEFSFSQAFFWSPDSKKIAFLRFDESKVKEFQMTYYGELYPEQYRYKYPKAGENNSEVTVNIFNLEQNSSKRLNLGEAQQIYIPRIQWTKNPDILSIQRLNRHQNHFELLLSDVTSDTIKLIYDEKSPYYVDITDDLTFMPDGKSFLITSEQDGFNHIYLYSLNGTLIKQLTKGSFDVTKLYGYSEKYKKVYFQSALKSPINRGVYSVDLKGKVNPLSEKDGQNNAEFSADFSYFINTNSTINTPYYIGVCNNEGKELRLLKNNASLIEKLKSYNLPKFEFFTIEDSSIKLPDGKTTHLNAWKVLPPDFDPSRKYPVLVYIYGGPGAQTVSNAWGGANGYWFQHLAQKGIVVVSVDNRGTGARGSLFKKMTYLELGKFETEDLITTARYLAQLQWVDASRLSVFGWSYGGYMASLGITKGADYFKAAIAVAPVTNWRYYDNIYTERYMRLPIENEGGYDNNSPINHVGKIKGNLLLVHGSGDDNVHYQNSMEMINALVKANKQFDLMIYPNRNHGIYGGSTRLHLYTKMGQFLDENLLDSK